jgi:hypothetical protein
MSGEHLRGWNLTALPKNIFLLANSSRRSAAMSPDGLSKSLIRMLDKGPLLGRGREDVVSVKAYWPAMLSVCFLLLAATPGRTQAAHSFGAGASYKIAVAQRETRPVPPMPIPYVAHTRSALSAPLPRPRPSEFASPKAAGDVPRSQISATGSSENSGSSSESGAYRSPGPTAPAPPVKLPPPPPIND